MPTASSLLQVAVAAAAALFAVEAERLVLRRRYVDLKIAYWRSVEDGDASRTRQLSAEALALAEELRSVTHD